MKTSMGQRWKIIGGLLVSLSIVGAAYWHFQLRRSVGSGPAGPLVRTEAFQKPWTDRPVLLVGLGDSVTAGFGASPGKSYFDRLLRNPADEFPDMQGLTLPAVLPHLMATNLSVSGSTSPQHARAQIPKLRVQPTNVLGLVVMTTGGNDIIHNYGKSRPVEGAMYGATWEQAEPWITNFASRLETMLSEIHKAFPGCCHVFLANIYDPTDGVGDIQNAGLPAWPDGIRIHAEYNRIIAAAAERHPHVHLVDIHGEFLGHGIHCAKFWHEHHDRHDPHYWYFDNLEDPNDRGYDALRRLFLNAISEVFTAPPSAQTATPAVP